MSRPPVTTPCRAILRPLALCWLLLQAVVAAAQSMDAPLLTLTPQQHQYDVAAVSQYLVDPGSQLTIEQLLQPRQEMAWRPVMGTASSFGFSDAAYWLRFDLINRNPPDADHFVELHYPLLDEINLYLVHQGQVIYQVSTGDELPYASRPYAFRNFLFKPPLPRGELLSLYVRIKNQGSLLAPLQLWHEHDFYIHEQEELAAQGLYFGVLLAFSLYNGLLFLFTRERATAYLTIYIITLGMFHASLFGLGYQYLWPHSPTLQQYSIPFFMSLALFAALRFAHHFLSLSESCPKGVWLLQGLSLLSLLLIVSLPLFPYSLAVRACLMLVLLSATLLLLASFIAWRRLQGDAGFFFAAWLVFLLAVIASASDKLGWGGIGYTADLVMQLAVMLQISIFTLAEAKRRHEEHQQRLAIEQQTAQELARQVKERTAALEEANRRLDAMSHTDGLTGLSNRRRFDEELERQYGAAVRNATPISLAMLDIDLFKRINDDHGHQVGDDYLRLIAALIAAEVKRPLDIACRYGGEEFALILPDTPSTSANTIAECIRSAVESLHHRVGEEVVPVTISIGTATLTPQRDSTPASLVQLADQALYRAKEEGRNRVVSC